MLTRRLIRPKVLLRPAESLCERCAQVSQSWTAQRRLFHPSRTQLAQLRARRFPQLVENEDVLAHLEREGVYGLYSPDGYKLAWLDTMQRLHTRLNALTAGSNLSDSPPYNVIAQTARDPTTASTFNHASMLYNHFFYFQGLKLMRTEEEIQAIAAQEKTKKELLERGEEAPRIEALNDADPELETLVGAVRGSFGSVENLRSTMLNTAQAMFGPGFVWLVQTNSRDGVELKILTTYIAGSPLPQAHWRLQNVDMNTQNLESYGSVNTRDRNSKDFAGSFGGHSQANKDVVDRPQGSLDVKPLLCVSTWEHAYIRDWGTRKADFLAAWWDSVDWNRVSRNIETRSSGFRPVNFERRNN